MRSIHYFPRYSQRENTVTNNTLLLLLRLMEASRTTFELFLTRLAGDSEIEFSPQWLRIGQQHSIGSAVVDGFIAQDSFKIAVETKLAPLFSVAQLARHLNVFEQEDHRLLLLLAPSRASETADLREFIVVARKQRVAVMITTFERVIEVMRSVLSSTDDEMNDLLDDFEAFCAESDYRLLPNDRFMMFTPPCGPSHLENERFRLYYCPADRPIRRAHFLGIYTNRAVRAVGRISKILECVINIQAGQVHSIDDTRLTQEERERVLAAAKLAPNHGWNISTGHRFYLCDEWQSTNFLKESPGGIMGARMIDLRKVSRGLPLPETLAGIAQMLHTTTWA